MTHRAVALKVDQGTAAYLRVCARRRGGSMAAAAARQLRELALADSVEQLEQLFPRRGAVAEGEQRGP